jgi:hypothetical protein
MEDTKIPNRNCPKCGKEEQWRYSSFFGYRYLHIATGSTICTGNRLIRFITFFRLFFWIWMTLNSLLLWAAIDIDYGRAATALAIWLSAMAFIGISYSVTRGRRE